MNSAALYEARPRRGKAQRRTRRKGHEGPSPRMCEDPLRRKSVTPEKTSGWQRRSGRGAPHRTSSGGHRLKRRRAATTRPVHGRTPKPRHRQALMSRRCGAARPLQKTVLRCLTKRNTLLQHEAAIALLGYVPKGAESSRPRGNLCAGVYGGSIRKCPAWKTPPRRPAAGGRVD